MKLVKILQHGVSSGGADSMLKLHFARLHALRHEDLPGQI